jgi:hypothetical protein
MKNEAESTTCTVWIPYGHTTVILEQISRRRNCVVFWKFWHVSQGGRTAFITLVLS